MLVCGALVWGAAVSSVCKARGMRGARLLRISLREEEERSSVRSSPSRLLLLLWSEEEETSSSESSSFESLGEGSPLWMRARISSRVMVGVDFFLDFPPMGFGLADREEEASSGTGEPMRENPWLAEEPEGRFLLFASMEAM